MNYIALKMFTFTQFRNINSSFLNYVTSFLANGACRQCNFLYNEKCSFVESKVKLKYNKQPNKLQKEKCAIHRLLKLSHCQITYLLHFQCYMSPGQLKGSNCCFMQMTSFTCEQKSCLKANWFANEGTALSSGKLKVAETWSQFSPPRLP